MKKHIFIINPTAGKHKALEMTHFIVKHFDNPEIVPTEYPGHASELAKNYAGKDTIIYSVGGDGTLNEVINGVMTSDYASETIIADVPCGSGNDLIKSFTDEKDPYVLLEKYKAQHIRTLDTGVINGRSFVNISSVGFDAEIVLAAKKYKKLPLVSAELAYLISVFATLIRLKDYKMKIRIDDDEVFETNVLFLTMANGMYYGGGMMAAPDALVDDGLFDFCMVDKIKRREVPFLLPKFMKGDHEKLKVVHTIKGKKMIIDSDKPLPVNIDGELLLSDHVEVEIKEGTLNFMVP